MTQSGRACIQIQMTIAKLAVIAILLILPGIVRAQRLPLREVVSIASEAAPATDLPDAPSMSSSASVIPAASPFAFGGTRASTPPVAPLYEKYILPGQSAQPLTARDKVLLGLHELESPLQLVTIASAAAYEHVTNGSPNYGTNLGAYGQRVGAAAIRDASRTLFTDSVAAPLLHEDPRYYIMGRRRNPVVRGGYAITRVFVTRTNAGATEPNYAMFLGLAGVAGLNNAFYPPDNQGFSETAKGFAGSFGGAAIGNVAREFLPDLLHLAHLQR